MILAPGHYQDVPAYRLLEATAHGTIAVDHRLLHAILDDPEKSIPDLARFAAAAHGEDNVDLEPQLLDIFRYLKTPQAIPFFVELVRRTPDDVSDELTEALIALGAAAVEPLLDLLKQLDDPGDLPFLLSELGVRDSRIFEVLVQRLDSDLMDGTLCLEIYGDAAAIPALQTRLAQLPADDWNRPQIQFAIDTLNAGSGGVKQPLEPFDIWELYPETEWPVFEKLSDDERLAMLASDSAELRARVAQSYGQEEPPLRIRARLLELARADPEVAVRGACWEGLGEISDEPEVRRAMLGVLRDSTASVEEKAGAAIALALESDNPAVASAIEGLYADPKGRAKALKAMARSLNRRYASYPGRHLDDPDPEIKRQAVWGIGYLTLSSEAPRLAPLFEQEEYRDDALFAYALSIPGDTSRGRVQALLDKIGDAAGGLKADEETLVQIALDQRLMIHGLKPVFFPDESDVPEEDRAVSSGKVGRNDPCPCGSGKKYKKCCGA